jgi:hypothetical protein
MLPNIKENIGKALLDVAKLTFASFILGGILRGELPQFIHTDRYRGFCIRRVTVTHF